MEALPPNHRSRDHLSLENPIRGALYRAPLVFFSHSFKKSSERARGIIPQRGISLLLIDIFADVPAGAFFICVLAQTQSSLTQVAAALILDYNLDIRS